MNYYNQPQPQFDQNQFRQMVINLPDNMLAQLVAQARLSGIANKDIEVGLQYINSIRNQPPKGV